MRWIAQGQLATGNSHARRDYLHWIHDAGPNKLDESIDLAAALLICQVFLNQIDSGAGQYKTRDVANEFSRKTAEQAKNALICPDLINCVSNGSI